MPIRQKYLLHSWNRRNKKKKNKSIIEIRRRERAHAVIVFARVKMCVWFLFHFVAINKYHNKNNEWMNL